MILFEVCVGAAIGWVVGYVAAKCVNHWEEKRNETDRKV